MKLGDNMTMEAYNIWGGVPPRKCRPPKIGDIPKHTAIDEESPGSISKSLPVPSLDLRDSSLNAPLDSATNIVFPLDTSSATEHLSSIQQFKPKKPAAASTETGRFWRPQGAEPPSLSFVSRVQDSRSPGQESILRQESFSKRLSGLGRSKDRPIERFGDPDSKVPITLPSKEATLVTKEREDSFRIPSSPEDLSDQEIIEVRKDSALFLEEAEGLPTLRDILKSRGSKIIRPRRESSGYASNLGTFDEDRRSSSSTDVLQDLSSFPKERRRSSTGPKRLNSRVLVCRAEESLTEEVADLVADRMPTTEVHRKVSSVGLDMPNIDEVKEALREEVSSRQALDSLCNRVKHVTVDELSTHCRLLGDTTDTNVSLKAEAEVLSASETCITPRLQDTSAGVIDTSFSEPINRLSTSPTSRNMLNRVVHQRVVPFSPNWNARSVTEDIEKPNQDCDRLKLKIGVVRSGIDEPADCLSTKVIREKVTDPSTDNKQFKVHPKSIKVYQLLSTHSDDRSDGELHSTGRRISLQMSKQEDTIHCVSSAESKDDVALRESRSTLMHSSSDLSTQTLASIEITDDSQIRKVSSPGDVGTSQRFLGDASNVTVRPIYPYCPYSPYGSPQGSPRNRRRPLRESRRVSIDNRQGALQLNQYKLLDNIGQGSYGIVKLVYNEEDETHYAMKILSKKKLMKKAGIFGRMAPGRKGTANPLAKVYREIALLKKLDHPNVVKLVEVLDDPDEDNLYLVFELVERGEILQIPTDKPLDEETVRKNFRDVVMGVEYLHYHKIVHRDIKPSNLLVDSDGRIKIADLGVSAELRASGELLSGPAGTPAFAAPETTTPGAHYSGTLCDMWSMGVTLYSLVTGRVPWDGAGSIIGVQAAVRTEPLKFPQKPALSYDLIELITKMLAKNPAERITLAEIKEHSWLTNHGTEPLPSEVDNCRLPVTVTDEEVERVVTRIPKLDTLILIKTMLKQHSFQNPFLPKKSGRTACADTVMDGIELCAAERAEETLASKKGIRNAKTERFQRTGRSNSAPDSYDWQINGRQISVDSPLPPVTEASTQETETEKR
ncbi:uncharacterized protein LOC143375897 [Andrena cerasifolii]|uniref:uncharacterized protein LOC143375897 n=1 Tax=Andrena cerasifolii TaxID=2819439 RepID=UPI0040382716